MSTPLNLYGTNVASTTVTTASKLATALGGTGSNTFIKIGTATQYVEVLSQGSSVTPTGAASIPAPTGKGWLLDATTLEGQQLLSGNYAPSIRLATSVAGVSITADLSMRAYKRSSAGVYTLIGSLSLTAQSITTTATTYTITPVSESSMTFATGDKYYQDAWVNITTNSSGNTTFGLNLGQSSTALGLAGRVEMDTPGYQVAPTTRTLDLASRVRVATQSTLDLASRIRIATQATRDLASRIRIATQATKDIAARVRIQAGGTLRTLDLASRVRVATQATRDLASRVRIATQATRDLAGRIRVSTQRTLDLASRVRIASQAARDLAARVRVGSQPVVRDLAARVRVATARTVDMAARVRIQVPPLIVRDLVARLRVQNQPYVPPPPVRLSVLVNSQLLTIKVNSFSWIDDLLGRSSCSFVVEDASGSLHFTFRQQVQILHSQQGTIFTGFVNNSDENNLYPNPNNEIAVTCIDEHWIADKRSYSGQEFEQQGAGTIAASLAQVLSSDGVLANYAVRTDTITADFAQGQLTNVVASANVGASAAGDGDLELAPAGTTFSKVESTTTDWLAPGSVLNGTYYANNQLTLFPVNALKVQGTSSQGGNNNYSYVKIWAGSQSIASGDMLTYFVWVSSTSPAIMAGVDAVCTDGTTLRDYKDAGNNPLADGNGLALHPNTDLSGYANDERYKRSFDLSLLAGKTLASVSVVLEGDPAGTYTAYFDTIQLLSSAFAVKQSFYLNSLQTIVQLFTVGYAFVSVTPVTTYTNPGTRLSPVLALDSVGISRTSLLSWTSGLLTTPTATAIAGGATGAAKTPYVLIESTIDGGATWQACTNFQPIPNLLAGMNMAGRSIQFRQTLSVAGPDPTISPVLYATSATITPAYATTKTDVVQSYGTQLQWQNGTLTNVATQNAGDLTLFGQFRNWNTGDTSNQSLYGADANKSGKILTSQYAITTTGAGTDVRSRLTFAGQWADFSMEADVYINSFGDYGMVYRTTGWQDANNTFGYCAMVTLSSIYLAKGSNASTGAGAFTTLTTVSGLSLAAGVWHRLKVVCSGSNHRIYLDDVLYINWTDATYTAAGYFGLRYFNAPGATHSGFFDNFGVVSALSGTWLSQLIALNTVGVVRASQMLWNAVVPTSSTLLIESTIDGGATWQACTSGASIAGLTAGVSTTGMSLQLRATLSGTNANVTADLLGLSVFVLSRYQASGVRVAPALSLASVGRAGDTLVDWSALLPTDATTLGVDLSLDAVTWTDVTGQKGQAIPLLGAQDAPIYDSFDADTSTNYTASALIGGTTAVWSMQPQKSRVVATGGTNACLFSLLDQALGDGEMVFDSDQCDAGGVAWNVSSDLANGYWVLVRDDSAPAQQNTITLFKMRAGTSSQLSTALPIVFARTRPTRIRVVQSAGTITAFVDGMQVLSYTESSPLAPGMVGLFTNGGTNRFSQVRIVSYGDDVSGRVLYSRQRLATSDPLLTPQVESMTLSVTSSSISTGVVIPRTTYSAMNGSTNTIAQDLDDLAKQSNYWWKIRQRVFSFQPRHGVLSPWIATGKDMLVHTKVTVKASSDLYRNDQRIIGGTDVEAKQDIRFGDGLRTSFDTGDPIESLTGVLIGGLAASFGVQGVDTGKDWYYQKGQKGIVQAANAIPIGPGQQVSILYLGLFQVAVHVWNQSQIDQIAAQDGTSGIVSVTESAAGLNNAAAIQLAVSRLEQYGVLAQDITFTSQRAGLQSGQLLTVFFAQHGLTDQEFLITRVSGTFLQTVLGGQEGLLGEYTIHATNGPDLGSWEYLY